MYLSLGIVLAHLIEKLKPNSIPLNKLNYNIDLTSLGKSHSKSMFEIGENLNAVVDGAKKLKDLGVVIVNLGANDILEKNVDIVLGLGNVRNEMNLYSCSMATCTCKSFEKCKLG